MDSLFWYTKAYNKYILKKKVIENALTTHTDFTLKQMNSMSANATAVVEIGAAQCTIDNWRTILIVAAYISPNKDNVWTRYFIIKFHWRHDASE